MVKISERIAAEARLLRHEVRRTRAGQRARPWREIADELARRGHGRFRPEALARAVLRLPAAEHPLAPLPSEALAQLEATFRVGWARDFPAEPWPGLADAQRRLRLLATGRDSAPRRR